MDFKKVIFSVVCVALVLVSCAKKEEEESTETTYKYYAYVTMYDTANPSKLLVYSINTTTGVLTLVETQDLNANSQSIVATSNEKYLYTSNVGGSVSAFSINKATGALTAIETESGSVITNDLAIAANDDYLYAGTANGVKIFSIDSATGALAASTTTSLGSTIKRMAMTSDGKQLYNFTSGNTIYHVNITTTDGSLSPQNASGIITSTPIDLMLDPTSNFLYTTEGGSTNKIYYYSVNATTGAITFSSVLTNNSLSSPAYLKFHPTLNVLYAVRSVTGIDILSKASDGALTYIETSTDSGASSAEYGIDILQTGAFAYTIHDSGISIFSVNSTTGVLTHSSTVDTSTYGSHPSRIKILKVAQ